MIFKWGDGESDAFVEGKVKSRPRGEIEVREGKVEGAPRQSGAENNRGGGQGVATHQFALGDEA